MVLENKRTRRVAVYINGMFWKTEEVKPILRFNFLSEDGKEVKRIAVRVLEDNSYHGFLTADIEDEHLHFEGDRVVWREAKPGRELPRHLRGRFRNHMKVSRRRAGSRKY